MVENLATWKDGECCIIKCSRSLCLSLFLCVFVSSLSLCGGGLSAIEESGEGKEHGEIKKSSAVC